MKKVLPLIICVLILGLSAVFALNASAKEKTIPQYSKWFAVEEKINDKIVKRVYIDNKMLPEKVSTIVEFVLETESPRLLIWGEQQINEKRAIYRFYKRKNQQWALVDINVFEVGTLPPNEKVPLFSEKSTFGQAFFQLHQSVGILKKDVAVPFVTNLKE